MGTTKKGQTRIGVEIRIVRSQYGGDNPAATVTGGTEFRRLAAMHRVEAAVWDVLAGLEENGGTAHRRWAVCGNRDCYRVEMEPCEGAEPGEGLAILKAAAKLAAMWE